MTLKLDNSKGRESLTDLGIEGTVKDGDSTSCGHVRACFEGRLYEHENFEAIQLLGSVGTVRRLQREKPFELV
jgi:hypothetical protein